MNYIYYHDMIFADIHDERSDIYFTISGLTFEELQDLISYQKTFRVELIYYEEDLEGPKVKDVSVERYNN